MNKAEALQEVFKEYEKEWANPPGDKQEAKKESVERLKRGEVLRFEYSQWSNQEPVKDIMRQANAVGQQDLGLFIYPTIHVFIPKHE